MTEASPLEVRYLLNLFSNKRGYVRNNVYFATVLGSSVYDNISNFFRYNNACLCAAFSEATSALASKDFMAKIVATVPYVALEKTAAQTEALAGNIYYIIGYSSAFCYSITVRHVVQQTFELTFYW